MTDPITPSDEAAAAVALDTRADARNRGLRTALQALAVAMLVDVIPVLLAALDAEVVNVRALVKAIVRVALSAALAFGMRYLAPPPAPEA
jgi:hypothetical protein